MTSASLSLSANPSTTSRRHPSEKTSSSLLNLPRNAVILGPAFSDPIHLRVSNINPVPNRPLPNLLQSPSNPSRRTSSSIGKPAKPQKSTWFTSFRGLTQTLVLLLVIAGLVETLGNLWDTKDNVGVDFEGKYGEMRMFVKRMTTLLQVQVDVVDRKVEEYAVSLREEMKRSDVRLDEKLATVHRDLKNVIEERLENLVSRDEFEEYLNGEERRRDGIGLEDIRSYAREVARKEIETHAADGDGRVDYALGAAGGRVVKHSAVYLGTAGRVRSSLMFVKRMIFRSRVHKSAQKVLTPSFGEPGSCFPLKGSSGYVTIKLRTAVVPEAITLEHVAESVAYDRSSAPKDCRVYASMRRYSCHNFLTT